MSETFILSGRGNVLQSNFNPPILLDPNLTHHIALVYLSTYNSIPNITGYNNKFYYWEGNNLKSIVLPPGAYEIEQIESVLSKTLGSEKIELKPNNSTLKSEIKSAFKVDFTQPNTFHDLLGFQKRVLQPDILHVSDEQVNILPVNTILIDCNLVTGSYVNGETSHTIYAFTPDCPPGFKIVISPQTLIYSRLSTNYIERLQLNIIDQSGNPVKFGNEEVTVRLHIKSS